MWLYKRHLFGLLAACLAAALFPSNAFAAPTATMVAGGLDSPRGVAFVNGRLLVAEAGHGGTDCFASGGPAGTVCFGDSGRIAWIDNGVATPLPVHLLSVTARGGFDVEGPSGLSVDEGRTLLQIATPPQEAPPPPTITAADYARAQAQAGRLISVHPNGAWDTVAQVGKFDYNYTLQFPLPPGPGTQEHDANPYGVLGTEGGAYVADAGSNTLDRIGEDGQVRVLIHDPFRFSYPNFPSDSVPTCVVKTEDGLLVGELSGRVLEVHGTTFSVISDPLFTHITGCTSDHHGNVYFVNMFGPGATLVPGPPAPTFLVGNVVKYDTGSGKASMLLNGLTFPNMDTVGPDGNLYVSVGSNCPSSPLCHGASGGVVRITLPHADEND